MSTPRGVDKKRKVVYRGKNLISMSLCRSKHPSIHLIQSYTTNDGLVHAQTCLIQTIIKIEQSHVDCQNVRFVERLQTIWALPHAIGDAILNTVVAEGVSTSLEGGVFEVVSATGAKSKSLEMSAGPIIPGK